MKRFVMFQFWSELNGSSCTRRRMQNTHGEQMCEALSIGGRGVLEPLSESTIDVTFISAQADIYPSRDPSVFLFTTGHP